MIVKTIVAGSDSNGVADLFFIQVECEQSQVDNGEHFDAAGNEAKQSGYEEPFVCFDEFEPAGNDMLALFDWKTASTIILPEPIIRHP